MNLIRSFAILFASGVATSQAQVRRRADDKTPATKAICDDIENGQAKGLCIAYCEAKDSVTEAEDHPSCATFKADLEEVIGGVKSACLAEVSSSLDLEATTTSPAPTTSPATCDCACNCDFTNEQPFASFLTWGNLVDGEDDYCPDGTPGWNYAICLQTSDVDVEKTRGTITLFPPASSCANVQQEIVCKIDKFRPPSTGVFFAAAGRASYDGATHPCFVRFGKGSSNFIDFYLLKDDADPDNGWIYTNDGYPPFDTWYRQVYAGGSTEGSKLTDNMLEDLAVCGILPE